MTDTSDSSSHSPSHEGYVLDAENAAEMARLMLMDHLLTGAIGRTCPGANQSLTGLPGA